MYTLVLIILFCSAKGPFTLQRSWKPPRQKLETTCTTPRKEAKRCKLPSALEGRKAGSCCCSTQQRENRSLYKHSWQKSEHREHCEDTHSDRSAWCVPYTAARGSLSHYWISFTQVTSDLDYPPQQPWGRGSKWDKYTQEYTDRAHNSWPWIWVQTKIVFLFHLFGGTGP